MNAEQQAMLTAIQALSIAAHEQTGIPTAYSCYTTELDGDLRLHVGVTIMPDTGAPWSLRASTSPYPTDDEMSLPELRDELATWIAANRKEVAA
ncbi:hypothetical protein EQG41_18125 [Billgrantia azerbaijanica]|nr:hypothetical protein EQG41_18125 [Halomonas azerbaijanica]